MHTSDDLLLTENLYSFFTTLYLQTWAKQNFYAMKQRNNIHSLKKKKTITKPKDNFNFTTEIASMDQRRNLLKKKRYRYKML